MLLVNVFSSQFVSAILVGSDPRHDGVGAERLRSGRERQQKADSGNDQGKSKAHGENPVYSLRLDVRNGVRLADQQAEFLNQCGDRIPIG
jgi:hypothetical protein